MHPFEPRVFFLKKKLGGGGGKGSVVALWHSICADPMTPEAVSARVRTVISDLLS